ncbi:esterase-like activity of phytase family protein [Thermomonospora umbrina]|uniref:Phytase-like domain-containing protein n=1 Tax=Thermomonospora umbrina TaxID=111806 RepID=A0A3D9SSY3_9ACTN|nr:esterase-like activity of phytase family protein [Thermomonospora umbrina]REE94811.1 hypothetical protein DFJ69_0176 [Thermomonospora umbrina]
MRTRTFVLPAAAAVALAVSGVPAGTAAASAVGRPDRPGFCSPSASLLGFSDALDKSEVSGTAVSGLSALGLDGRGRAVALVDNIGTTPARIVEFSLRRGRNGLDVAASGATTLKRPDGTPYNGGDFDGEGLVIERGGRTVLASSESEPSIRRFRRGDGGQSAELPVPERFRVAPAGQAARNQTFESLAASPDGRTLYGGMEGSLAPDGPGAVRILSYRGRPGGAYEPAAQYAYRTDASLGLVELVALGDGGLLALERGFTAGVGNTVRVYRASTRGARDVTDVGSLRDEPGAALRKEPVVDLVDCPPSGATARQPQPNPLLDNVEGMALGGPASGGRRVLYLVSDDNGNAAQITRVYALSVRLGRMS